MDAQKRLQLHAYAPVNQNVGNPQNAEFYPRSNPISFPYKLILDEIFMSGSMPKFTAYLREYEFYPYDVDPETLSLEGHFYAYANNIPFLCLYYANVVLRGVGQVYICNNPVTGLFVCIGLCISSPVLMMYGLLGAAFANIGALVMCPPATEEIESGLFGYDGTLVGCAIYTFLSMDQSVVVTPSLWNRGVLVLMVLSFVVGVMHSSCVNMNKLPALTLAFNIVMLAFLLSVARGNTTVATLTWMVDNPAPGPGVSDYWQDVDFRYFLDALFRGVGQFCFVGTTVGGVMVVLGIFICSRQGGCMALAGSCTALIVARYILVLPPANRHLIRLGLYGYNAVGTCVAVGGDIFFKADYLSTTVAVFGAGVTVLLQAAVQSILNTDGLGLPVLTVPFVMTAWIVMLCRSDWLKPILGSGEDLDDARMLDRRHEDTWLYRPKKRIFNESPARRERRLRKERDGMRALGEETVSPMLPPQEQQELLQVGEPGACASREVGDNQL